MTACVNLYKIKKVTVTWRPNNYIFKHYRAEVRFHSNLTILDTFVFNQTYCSG